MLHAGAGVGHSRPVPQSDARNRREAATLTSCVSACASRHAAPTPRHSRATVAAHASRSLHARHGGVRDSTQSFTRGDSAMTLTIRWRCATAALSFALASGISAHAAQVQEIPVTTTSAAARLDFEAGQAAAARGDAQRANALFKHAVTLDPGFAYAWLNLANTSLSAQEFNSALETARRNGAAASEGERLLVDVGLTFIDNDADKRLTLSQKLVDRYPESPRAWINLGGVLGGLNRNVEARAAMHKAKQPAPKAPP